MKIWPILVAASIIAATDTSETVPGTLENLSLLAGMMTCSGMLTPPVMIMVFTKEQRRGTGAKVRMQSWPHTHLATGCSSSMLTKAIPMVAGTWGESQHSSAGCDRDLCCAGSHQCSCNPFSRPCHYGDGYAGESVF
jgi:hypothetical protein